MRRLPRRIGGLGRLVQVALLSIHCAAWAQPAAALETRSSDPGTPRGAMRFYLEACREGDYASASRFLDLRRIPPGEREIRGKNLARQLKRVLDRTLWIHLESVSDSREGDLEDGLARDLERVGSIAASRGSVEVMLRRTKTQEAVSWRFAPGTVALIPELYREFGDGALGEWLPAPFFEWRFLELYLWQWIGLAGLVLIAVAASWLAVRIGLALARSVASRIAPLRSERLLAQARNPARLALAAAIFGAALPLLALSVPVQTVLSGIARVLLMTAIGWFSFRLIDLALEGFGERLMARGQAGAVAILAPAGRVAKAALAVLVLLLTLQGLGVNVTAVLAGLGVGGIAIALASQRTLENLFGGVTLITDQPVRVGDFCRFGDKRGTVEEIGLRSTRVRTLERTLITIPNADFSRLELENFTQRDRIWYNPTLGLRYETTPEQLRYVLVGVRRMLYSHPRVLPDAARIRFVGFGASSLDLEIFAYVDSTDYGEYLEVAEDLNLRIMEIVSEAGSSFAFPSQTLYVEKGEGLDRRRGKAAEAEVARWRADRQLYLPGFPQAEIERLRSSLDYPPEGSPLRA
jgi:MscS family membrane protein